jgi:hypothetical protein
MSELPPDGFTAEPPSPERKKDMDVSKTPEQTAPVEHNLRRHITSYWREAAVALGIGIGAFYGGTKYAEQSAALVVAEYDMALRAIENGNTEIEDKVMGNKGLLNAKGKGLILDRLIATLQQYEPAISRSPVLKDRARQLSEKIRESRRILLLP